ncbi:unnamed protein product, partial [Meganyctiphanes norvegica]
MTILPKKKPQQAGGGAAEVEAGEASSSGHNQHINQHSLPIGSIPNHLQSSEGTSRSSLYLSSQSPPPCWPPPPAAATTREEKRLPHTSPSHYDPDALDSSGGPSHSKRRYRASPLRSVRPKHRGDVGHREHRGNASPPYQHQSTSSGWNVTPVTHPHPHPHSLAPQHHTHPPTHPHPLTHAHQHPHGHSLGAAIPTALQPALSPQAGPSRTAEEEEEEAEHNGYNSGDEYEHLGWNLTAEQWEEKERWFEKKMKKKGLIIKKMREDGACLFRAIADQVFGDQEMHGSVRKHCMDYIASNEDAFAPFVSENFQTYVQRKRRDDCFGNHIEIAAMSEMYNRVIEVYCYSVEPINIFQGTLQTENAPMRLSYHMGTHYNSLVDPYKATVGVGLGLPNFHPGQADKNLMNKATKDSENQHLEQAMLEDKIRATDYEATSEAIEEQIAHESYLQWLRDNEQRAKAQRSPSGMSGGSSSGRGRSSPLHQGTGGGAGPAVEPGQLEAARNSPRSSPRASDLVHSSPRDSSSPRGSTSPRTSTSVTTAASTSSVSDVDLAVPGSSKDPMPSWSSDGVTGNSSSGSTFNNLPLDERASFLNQLPPDMFGLQDYSSEEADILAQVLAASQQEYLDSLKSRKDDTDS